MVCLFVRLFLLLVVSLSLLWFVLLWVSIGFWWVFIVLVDGLLPGVCGVACVFAWIGGLGCVLFVVL